MHYNASTLRQWRVYVCSERKGWRLYVCECVSFFSSLSECLFLDRFEGQGLATGGEKAVFPFKRKEKKKKKKLLLSLSLFTMKRSLNTHHPLKALTLALPYFSSQQIQDEINVIKTSSPASLTFHWPLSQAEGEKKSFVQARGNSVMFLLWFHQR